MHIESGHEGKKSFRCNECDSAFTKKGLMIRHVESVHKGKKPHPKRTKNNFQCKECNKSFRDNYKLKIHEKVHMKMKLPEKTLYGQNLGEASDSSKF